VDKTTIDQIQEFFLRFRGILFEALPWIIIGAAFAGLVEVLPPRRSPGIMVALGVVILLLTVLPLPLYLSVLLAVACGLAAWGLLWIAQPVVDRSIGHLAQNRTLAILLSGFLGLVNPMCDCGVIVIMRRFLRKGMPLSCCIAYILAGPIVNVLVIATTVQAFAVQDPPLTDPSGKVLHNMSNFAMAGMRVVLGYIVAVTTAFVVEKQFKKYGYKLLAPALVPSGLPIVEENGVQRQPFHKRLSLFAETALHDFVDVAVLLILGALLAAAARAFLITPERVSQVVVWSKDYPGVAMLFMMALAFLITLCSEADAFVAASFTIRPAAKLAFLVFGPMFDMKLLLMYTRVFRPRLMWTIIVCITLQVFLYCYLTHLVWENYAPNFMIAPEQVTPVTN
jgi:uncharacterized membrane protein YraQ (UPF0718 family)